MVNVQPRQNPQLLLDLKRGLDRDGRGRTWEEVGEMRGISGQHAQRTALGWPVNVPTVVRFDPRAIMPRLDTVLTSDEEAERWNDKHLCLCGCGQATLQETTKRGKVPYGGFRLFRGAHAKRMPWVRTTCLVLTPEQNRRRIRSLAATQDTLVAAGIVGLIQDWRAKKARNTYRELARRSGLHEGHIRRIGTGRRARIRKLTAARLLSAMNEPLRPELAAIHQEWVKQNESTVIVVT